MKTADIQKTITEKLKQLRVDHHWTQARLASLLGISQNRLSEIENKNGSISAEQLILLLKTFNVPLAYFLPPQHKEPSLQARSPGPLYRSASKEDIRNALVRLGAVHLKESPGILPSERLDQVHETLREVLVLAESSREITALAPVVVQHARHINLRKLSLDLDRHGALNRLGWFLDSLFEAVKILGYGPPTLPGGGEYRDAYDLLLNSPLRKAPDTSPEEEDVLERDLLSAGKKTRDEIRMERSPLAKKWGLLTRIQTADFIHALQEVFGAA